MAHWAFVITARRSGERRRPTFHPPRPGTVRIQPDKHWYCFEGILGETAERRGRSAYGPFRALRWHLEQAETGISACVRTAVCGMLGGIARLSFSLSDSASMVKRLSRERAIELHIPRSSRTSDVTTAVLVAILHEAWCRNVGAGAGGVTPVT